MLVRNSSTSNAPADLVDVMYRQGIPWKIVSDDAKCYLKGAVAETCRKLKIRQVTTGGHTPSSNPYIERCFDYIGRCLRILKKEEHEKWEEHISRIASAWNQAYRRVTGFSPFEARHGWQPRSPAMYRAGKRPREEGDDEESDNSDGEEVPSAEDLAVHVGMVQRFHDEVVNDFVDDVQPDMVLRSSLPETKFEK